MTTSLTGITHIMPMSGLLASKGPTASDAEIFLMRSRLNRQSSLAQIATLRLVHLNYVRMATSAPG